MKRLTETDRWKDKFFLELNPTSKLLLSYLYDSCDSAGFIDYIPKLWLNHLNGKKNTITTDDLKDALKELQAKLLSDKKNKLFIKDFLLHQKKIPLIKGQEESDWIIQKLKNNLEGFNNAVEIIAILESVELKSIEKIKPTPVRFSPPDYDTFRDYFLTEQDDATEDKIRGLYDHYLSCGWKVGNKPMKDWQAAVRNSIRRDQRVGQDKKSKTRTSTTLSAVELAKRGSQVHNNG